MERGPSDRPVSDAAPLGPDRATPPPSEALPELTASAAEETIVEGEVSPRGTLRIAAGDKIGRYIAIEKLGAGGMGVVWAAYDPELDRRVALKLLRPDGRSEKKREVARLRLQREAQAMAKLSHPNVVAVHDVGHYEGQIFVAMAYLPGGTLKSAFDAKGWTWEQTLGVLCDAGEGLAAAHEAGLVHRDFKPDNVILDGQGRPKVVDFGLVRATDSVSESESIEETKDTHTSGALSTSVTRVGAVMGTPAYMAPEQHMGREATPLSDQFSFCVTLFEGLYGRTPFPASGLMELAQRVLAGDIEAPPTETGVPNHVREAIYRGLHIDPTQRFANMAELLAALRDDRRSRKRRWLNAAGVGALGLALVTFGMQQGRDATPVCTGGQSELATAWGDAQREALRASFGASAMPYAADTLARTQQRLDDWGTAWTAGHKDACEATEVHKHQSAPLMDQRMACLGGQLRSLDARVKLLRKAKDEDIARAVDILDELPDPADCADTEALLRKGARAEGPHAPTIRGLLERAGAAQGARHFDEALALANEALTAAREHGEKLLEARALYRIGFVSLASGQPEAAAESLEAAGWLAVELDAPEDATRAWLHLADVVGDALGNDEGWPRWERAARASLARVPDPNTTLDLHLANALGGIHERNGRYVEAKAQYEAATRSMTERDVPLGSLRIHLLNNLGIAHLNLGEMDAALKTLREAHALYVEHYGPEHPDVAAALGNLGNALEVSGAYEEAIATQREALRLCQLNLPAGHIEIAAAHDNLGNALDGAGQTEAAIEHMRTALEIRKQSMGGEDPSVGISANNLGDALMRLGRMDEAVAHVETACKLFESGYGKDHPHTGICLNNLARVRHHQGRSREALAILERALTIHRAAFGEDHPILAYHYVQRGKILRDGGRRSDAIEALERAVKLREDGGEEAMALAEANFELAITLPQSARIRARSLAQRARDKYREAGDAAQKELAEVEAWLETP